MREIKFRGRCVSTNEWFYGDLVQKHNGIYITRKYADGYIDLIKVDLESVGQYTGLKDKNGRKIYEGDIVMQLSERTYDSLTGVVKFIDGSYVIETADGKNGGYLFDELAFNVLIGNIYENPELLEGIEYEK